MLSRGLIMSNDESAIGDWQAIRDTVYAKLETRHDRAMINLNYDALLNSVRDVWMEWPRQIHRDPPLVPSPTFQVKFLRRYFDRPAELIEEWRFTTEEPGTGERRKWYLHGTPMTLDEVCQKIESRMFGPISSWPS